MRRSEFDFSTAKTDFPRRKKRRTNAFIGIALIAGSLAAVGYMLSSAGVLSAVTLSADERVVKDYLEKGGLEASGIGVGGYGKKPKAVEFVQWGPHSKRNKVTTFVRVVYRKEGNLQDVFFQVTDGKVVGGNRNPYGDEWLKYLDEPRGRR